jgi:hypothetical protein
LRRFVCVDGVTFISREKAKLFKSIQKNNDGINVALEADGQLKITHPSCKHPAYITGDSLWDQLFGPCNNGFEVMDKEDLPVGIMGKSLIKELKRISENIDEQ